jgi:hypothetical protein
MTKPLTLKQVLATLLTMAALFAGQNAWAQTDVTLSEDNDFEVGTAGHWYVNMGRSSYEDKTLTLTPDNLSAGQNVFKVYDDGGKNGNYSSGCGSFLYITVPVGYLIQVSGTVWTKNKPEMEFLRLHNAHGENNDLATVYSDTDGERKDFGPLLTHKVTSTIDTECTDGQYLTVYFHATDNATTYPGFDMTVTVFKNTLYNVNIPESIEHGSLSASTDHAYYNEEVTLNVTPNENYYIGTVSYNDGTDHVITPSTALIYEGNTFTTINVYKFTMPQHDVTVNATFLDEMGHLWGEGNDGSAEHPYVISNQEGWDFLNTKEAEINGFTNNKHFRLDTDLTNVTQSLSRFGGHLDGNGHTITLDMTLDNNGLISLGINCTISNLTVEGSINNNIANVGGFVASSPQYPNTITLTNCRSSVTITSTYSGSGHYCGGLVGNAFNVTCERCVFDGAFIGSSYGFSGLVGQCSQLSLTDCIVVFGSTTNLTSQEGRCFSFADYHSITGNGQNFYYNKGSISGGIEPLGGTQTYTLTFSEHAAAVRTGGTAIGNGAGTAYADGFTLGNEEYYASGATVIFGISGIIATSAQYNNGTDHDATLNSDGTAQFFMPATTTTASVTGFAANYIDADGTMQTQAVSLLSSSDEAVNKPEGWYAVSGDVTINKGLTFSGAAHLILTDGATLSSNDNLKIYNTDETQIAIAATDLNIYGQTLGTGTLNASSENERHHDSHSMNYAYGIRATNITFCGGDVNATATGLKAIDLYVGGLECHAIHAEGTITIIRGHVSASATRESTTVVATLRDISANNGVFLDWRLPTDRIHLAKSIFGSLATVSVAEGKGLWNGTEVLSGTISDNGNYSAINGKTLQPCITREIEGYGTSNGGWAFIASPVTADDGILPTAVGNIFSAAEYDLYRFNQSANKEWENYKAHTEGFVLENGKGYLYATKDTKTLAFMGDAFNMGTAPVTVSLVYDGNAEFAGWNLVGNPFTVDAYVNRPFYKMNTDGTGIVAVENYDNYTTAQTIPACTGIVVKAENSGESVTFSTTAPELSAPSNGNLQITLTQAVDSSDPDSRFASLRGGTTKQSRTLDNAIVSFNEGSQLGKFYFGEQDGNIYIQQGGKEYAIVSVSAGRDVARYVSTEIPINFKAKENGEYTITVNPEGVEMGYLHLIDNMTGADVDLLASNGGDAINRVSTYTFTAKTTDYESRFRLVFSVCGDANDDDEAFAFINNGNIVINGEGMVQVVDVMGHILVSGDAMNRVSTGGMVPGVYVLRLINGNDVRTQKIVIR